MRFLVLALALAAAAPADVRADHPPERLSLSAQAPSKTIKGTTRGHDVSDYVIALREGQTLTVGFKTSNASSYFNIWAPGADTALFVGSVEGNRASVKAAASGDYRIQVYLMRNAARRNERANYTVSIGVK